MRVRCCEKAPRFQLSHHLGKKKKVKEGSNRGDVLLSVRTHWRDLGQVCVRFGLGILGQSLNRNVQLISYNFEPNILHTEG